ncbi:uncharacterized protein LOC112681547 [Sipha flava]|uniref:Uncharacterized protein LOC112681547 n=1 Tax=Sipha flava TaxID=143950 RepID=A0A8B8FAZ3_9HEMI|nr:uncharacterized protein LOC112681547 [Sipha flava]
MPNNSEEKKTQFEETREYRNLRRRRNGLKLELNAHLKFIQAYTEQPKSYQLINIRLEQVNEIINEFHRIQCQLEEMDTRDIDFHTSERIEFNEAACEVKALLMSVAECDARHSLEHSQSNTTNMSESMRLPAVPAPTFDGDLQNWSSFRDSFDAMFHDNKTLANVQKLHYLKSCLIGSAREVIKNITTTGDNYQRAYEALIARYENKSLTIQSHIRSLLDTPRVKVASTVELRNLHHHVISHIKALEALNQPIGEWDAWLVTLVCSRMDNVTAGEWQLRQQTRELPKFTDLETFLANRVSAYEVGDFERPMDGPTVTPKYVNHAPRQFAGRQNQYKSNSHDAKAFFTKNSGSRSMKCVLCAEPHGIYACDQFLRMPVPERKVIVNKFKLCFNCLNYGHQVASCNFSGCPRCGKRHNSKLHVDVSSDDSNCTSKQNETQSTSEQNTVLHARGSTVQTSTMSPIILATALIYVDDAYGKSHCCRAVLDSGSQLNFISSSCAQRLQLSKTNVSVSISGVGSMSSSTVRLLPCTISALCNDYQLKVEFYSLPIITEKLPSQVFDISQLNIPFNVKSELADPQFHIPAPVDILLGAELFYDIFLGERLQLSKYICLHRTKLGWILTGKGFESPLDQSKMTMLSTTTFNNSALSLFTSTVNIKLTNEEIRAEEHFNTNVKRIENGRFQVRLPLCADTKLLEGSQQMAKRRFFNLERRLSKDSALSQQYKSFMEEYLELDHMETVETSTSKPSYYLPHHPVFKAGSSTTKVRVVFDGSAVAPSGHSLNDILLKGPKVQPDISRILWRFRIHQVAITADIAKMYRQVVIASEDRDLQRIFYRSSPDELLKEYRLKTVTYGTKSASFLSTRCLVQIAKECSDMSIKRMTLQDFYVDDLISGGSTEDQCFTFYDKLQALLDSAGHRCLMILVNLKPLLQVIFLLEGIQCCHRNQICRLFL